MTETFRYDNLDRLDTVMFNNAVSIAYTMHDKVKSIQQGDDVLTIDYGYDRQRIGMTQQNDVLHTTSSKLYVGSCEFNHGEIRLERLTYLSGPMGVFAVYEELGSVTTVTNASGAIVQELSYDAWGNLRNPATWSGSITLPNNSNNNTQCLLMPST